MVERISDESLMLAYQAGDAKAFETLVARHRAAVFNFLLRLTGSRPRAEDLLQDTWLKVIRSAATWEAKAKLTTWIFTIARNLSMDALRKDIHRRTETLDAAGDADGGPALSDRLASGDAAPDRAAHNAAVRLLIERALAMLPAEQREVFVLREYAGVPFKEIAQITEVSENTVKSRMRYALEGLRRTLPAMGVEGDMAEEPETRTVAR